MIVFYEGFVANGASENVRKRPETSVKNIVVPHTTKCFQMLSDAF